MFRQMLDDHNELWTIKRCEKAYLLDITAEMYPLLSPIKRRTEEKKSGLTISLSAGLMLRARAVPAGCG